MGKHKSLNSLLIENKIIHPVIITVEFNEHMTSKTPSFWHEHLSSNILTSNFLKIVWYIPQCIPTLKLQPHVRKIPREIANLKHPKEIPVL